MKFLNEIFLRIHIYIENCLQVKYMYNSNIESFLCDLFIILDIQGTKN